MTNSLSPIQVCTEIAQFSLKRGVLRKRDRHSKSTKLSYVVRLLGSQASEVVCSDCDHVLCVIDNNYS